ncbi:IclR family transcriptional regulator [Castellaniella sp. WN]
MSSSPKDAAPKAHKKTSAADKPAVSNLQSLERAISLLRATAYSESGLRLTELADQAGLSKSTTHRILSWLVEHGLLRLSAQTRIYTPGSDLYRLGLAAARHFSLVDIARPCMQRLAESTEDTVYLSVIDGDEAVCAERVIGAYPIKTLTLAQGDRRPLGVGAGAMALLAALPPAEAQSIIEDESRRTPRYSGFGAEWLRRAVAEARRKGYAFNPERVLKGMSAIGVAVPGHDGRPICAISVAAISSRMNPARRTAIVAQLQQESAALARQASNLRSGDSL